ncbi:MAG: type IX secretion system membrane protein PorP/SprF, partial [Bacteroidota bacterium]
QDHQQAQQDPQFTQYLSNQLFFNPAYAGITGKTQATLIHRSQWAGYNPTFDDGTAPTTQVLSFSTAFPKFNSGVGIHFVNDRLGPINNVEVQLSYAYHVPLSKQSVLSFGIRGGLYTKIVDFNKFRFRDDDDPFNVEGRDAVLEPDMAIGVYYNSETLFASISANHLTRSEFNFGDRLNQEPLANTIYLFAGYNFLFGSRKEWTLTPTFLFKTAEFAESSFDVGGIVNYDEKFWVGSTFRNEESANILLGVNIPRRLKRKTRRVQHNIKLNYSFDYVFLGQDAKQPTSHEISISYDIPVRLPTPPAIIRSIRYRHD